MDYTWINAPVLDALQYFSELVFRYLGIARAMGTVFGAMGIAWYCIQLIFGTTQVRKVVVSIITRFAFFILILNVYYPVVMLVRSFATRLGSVGASTETITGELAAFMKRLERVIDADITAENAELAAAVEARQSLDSAVILNPWSAHSAYVDADIRLASAQRVADARRDSPDLNMKTLAAVQSVLKPVKSGEKQSGSYVEKYTLDIGLNDKNGDPTGYLSPNGILKISVLCAMIMWEKEWSHITTTMDDKKENGGFFAKNIPMANFELHWLFDMLLTFICMLCLVVATVFALCQYVMCILEYTIITSVAIIFVPMMLFDGTKAMADKVIPAILGLTVKLMIVTLCMFFAVYAFLGLAMNVITENSQMNIQIFAYVFFTVLLCFILTQNAPQLAVTMLTGSPRLSMGELVHAMATTAALGAGAARAAEYGRGALGAGARGAMNIAGNAAAAHGAWKQAAGMAESMGSGGAGQIAAGAKAGAGVLASRAGQSIKSGLHSLAHAGMGSGKGRGGGTGYNRFAQGAMANFHSDEKRNEALSGQYGVNTNGYGTAQNKLGQSMTAKEYLKQQMEQGSSHAQSHPPKPPKQKPPRPAESTVKYTGDPSLLPSGESA